VIKYIWLSSVAFRYKKNDQIMQMSVG